MEVLNLKKILNEQTGVLDYECSVWVVNSV